MDGVAALAVGALALAWWSMSRSTSSTSSTSSTGSTGSTGPESGPGWSSEVRLDLSPKGWDLHRRFVAMATIRGLTPLVFTSGRRSAIRQAKAMLEKVRLGGVEELAVYGDKEQVAELLASGRDPETWAGIIQRYIDIGRPISRHPAGLAFDLRLKDGTPGRAAALKQTAKDCGAKEAVVEADPYHLHVSA